MRLWDPARLTRSASKLQAYRRLLRIEHTLFSLPFAYAGALMASKTLTPWEALWILVAVVGLRTAAMAYNNIADLEIDRKNPRTASRPLVTGAVSLREAWFFVVLGSILYYLAAAALGPIPLLLSPILWAAAMTYPYAKRIHPLPHLHLGLVLGCAVLGGAVAAVADEVPGVYEALLRVPWLLMAGVTLWVSGFDVIYSIMDVEFDAKEGLKSLPVALGVRGALLAAAVMHACSAMCFLWSVVVYELKLASLVAALATAGLLAYQHALLRAGLHNIPRAFNVNLVVALVMPTGILVDRLAMLTA